MNFKKMMLITLLLLAVLTIGSVSADEDTDALAVDDAGNETVVEAPADENATQTAVADEDVVESEENTDTLASPYADFNDEVYNEYHSVCSISDFDNGINGTVSLFANETQVYNQEVSGEDYVCIMASDIIGSFYGTYNMKVVYNGTDGTNYEKQETVTFTKAIINKIFTPEDFNVTFPASGEVDLGKDPVILTYFWPEGVKERISSIRVVYGSGDFDYHDFETDFDPETDPVNVYKNVTWRDLNQWEKGTFNIAVYYCEDWQPVLLLGNATLNIKQSVTADDIIWIYDSVANRLDEDCLADIYDDEIEGLNGVVTAYANGAQIYTKKYSNYNRGGPIHAKDLKGTFNGVYTIKIEYKRADGKVFTVSKDVHFDNVVGEQVKTTLTASPTSVSMVYNTNKVLTVTLKDANGNPIKGQKVKIHIMGTSYDSKTDSKGKIKLSLSSLPPKTHSIKFEFKATALYKASSKTVKVVVKKATPKLTAKAKSFKKSVKTKKYTITLKTNKGKVMKGYKVTLKVNKKTYTGKTNKKGQITFKITNLKKKGKYTAVVKYAGNKYYKAKTVKPKITIK